MYVSLFSVCGIICADAWLAGHFPTRHRHSTGQGRLRATEAIYQRASTRVTNLFTSAYDDFLARERGMRYAHGS